MKKVLVGYIYNEIGNYFANNNLFINLIITMYFHLLITMMALF